MHRRTVLRTTALALTAGLAGCSGGGGSDTDTDPADAETATPTETPTDSPETPTETPTDSPETPTATAVGSPGTPTPTDGGTPTETPTESPEPASPTPTGTPSATPQQAAQVVEVAPGGELVFSPQTFEIAAGDTVRWVWRAGSHNVRADTTPDGSDWRGTPGSDLFGEGHEYEHVFEVPGEYSYFCVPHQSLGMTGSFTVTE